MSVVRDRVLELGLPFRFPEVEALAIIWPVAPGRVPEGDDADDEGADDDDNGGLAERVITDELRAKMFG